MSLAEIAAAVTGSNDVEAYAAYYLDSVVGADGADQTTIKQARQFSPDGEYPGPVTCVACYRFR